MYKDQKLFQDSYQARNLWMYFLISFLEHVTFGLECQVSYCKVVPQGAQLQVKTVFGVVESDHMLSLSEIVTMLKHPAKSSVLIGLTLFHMSQKFLVYMEGILPTPCNF